MFLMNTSPEAGCYNGTRLIVNDARNDRILICTIINGRNAGEEISISIIKLRTQYLTNQPSEWEILHFPVKLAYAMTINKSQGQTLIAVVGHFQLYDTVSITGEWSSIMFAVMPYKPDDPFSTVNLVYRHISDYTIFVLLIGLLT
jgi:hypothetical protein